MKGRFDESTAMLDHLLGVGRSFDMTRRSLCIGGRRAVLWVINGYAEDGLLERAISAWRETGPLEEELTLQAFLDRYVTVCDAAVEEDLQKAVTAVFSGKSLLVLEGLPGGILLDAKQFPLRGVEEPNSSKVLRGSHDGFVESLMTNAALLRRRIRDPALILERLVVGGRSRTDVALCYMEGEADPAVVDTLRQKLQAIDVGSVAMSQESISEAIVPRQWYNPFPKVRYTERPDMATASVMEGSVLLMVDNSPAVMVLPVSLFQFAEEVNDYYFPPLVGSYLRLVRVLVLLLTIFITPLWYLLVKDPGRLHTDLHFLLIQDEYFVPLIVQLLLVELIVDILKLASLNTPDTLGNSFSMLGALILGDFAVQSRWLVPEVLVYMAFVAIANFTQHSFELGYACKLCRMALLVLIWLLDWWGFGLGVLGVVVLLATNRPLVGKGYLYPLIPWDGKKLWALLHRRPIHKNNT
ncbi:MAG: spore germination protein [Ruminococcaceae bacterium]|nr:spore germination protein [Oscillospiraceae bacterium]